MFSVMTRKAVNVLMLLYIKTIAKAMIVMDDAVLRFFVCFYYFVLMFWQSDSLIKLDRQRANLYNV